MTRSMSTQNFWTAVALAVAASLPLSAPLDAQMEGDEDRAVEGGGEIPAGWHVRTDGDRPLDNVAVLPMNDGSIRVDVGPAVVLWEESSTASGNFTVSTTVQQLDSKGHPHGAGLIVGGADLQGPDQVYTYFLVRGDGSFLVKTRTGDETAYLTPEWTPHDALNADDENGTYVNELAIEATDESLIFVANGTELYRAPRGDVYVDGHFGYRLNHNLGIRFSPIELEGGAGGGM